MPSSMVSHRSYWLRRQGNKKMGFWKLLAAEIAHQIAEEITNEVVLIIRKRTRMGEIGQAASELKEELYQAQSAAEREAVLEKVHDLINGFNHV